MGGFIVTVRYSAFKVTLRVWVGVEQKKRRTTCSPRTDSATNTYTSVYIRAVGGRIRFLDLTLRAQLSIRQTLPTTSPN